MIAGLKGSLERFVDNVLFGKELEEPPWVYAIDISRIMKERKSLPTIEDLTNNGIPSKYAIVYLAYIHHLLDIKPHDKRLVRVYNLFKEIDGKKGKYITSREFEALLRKHKISKELGEIIKTVLVKDDYGGLALGTGNICEAIYLQAKTYKSL